MKQLHITVWSVLLLFMGVMIGVTVIAYSRKSNRYHLDTSQLNKLRETLSIK